MCTRKFTSLSCVCLTFSIRKFKEYVKALSIKRRGYCPVPSRPTVNGMVIGGGGATSINVTSSSVGNSQPSGVPSSYLQGFALCYT